MPSTDDTHVWSKKGTRNDDMVLALLIRARRGYLAMVTGWNWKASSGHGVACGR